MATPAQAALSALHAHTSCGSLRRTTAPTLETSAQPQSFTAATTYDFPDGGRFRVALSGPPLSLFVTGETGLPDGFLMEINNYIFATLLATPRTAHAAVADLLAHAELLFNKCSRVRAPPVEEEVETSRAATAALMKQLSLLDGVDTRREGFLVNPKEDNLYIWRVDLFFEDPLQKDLQRTGHESLELELRFPSDYPYAPPFVRVVAPYIRCRYVLPRGGICMQLFSTSGWTPANAVDAVCVQVRAMLLAGGVEVVEKAAWKYTYDGARRDLQNAVRQHRWDEIDRKDDSRRKKMKY